MNDFLFDMKASSLPSLLISAQSYRCTSVVILILTSCDAFGAAMRGPQRIESRPRESRELADVVLVLLREIASVRLVG